MNVFFDGAIGRAGIGVYMTGLAADKFLLRQLRVAQNARVGPFVFGLANRVGGIALDGSDACGLGISCGEILRHKTDVIRNAAAFHAEEDQIARYGDVRRQSGLGRVFGLFGVRFKVVLALGKQRDPVLTAGLVRQHGLGQLCVVQAERDEHCTPVAVEVAVPRAVARVAIGHAGCVKDIVARAFGVAKLAARNGQHVQPVVMRQAYILQRRFPLRLRLNIGRGVAV